MSTSCCGISAKQLERELRVTYKTAWRMFNVIRNSLTAEDGVTLDSEVEMDETYLFPQASEVGPNRPGGPQSQ